MSSSKFTCEQETGHSICKQRIITIAPLPQFAVSNALRRKRTPGCSRAGEGPGVRAAKEQGPGCSVIYWWPGLHILGTSWLTGEAVQNGEGSDAPRDHSRRTPHSGQVGRTSAQGSLTAGPSQRPLQTAGPPHTTVGVKTEHSSCSLWHPGQSVLVTCFHFCTSWVPPNPQIHKPCPPGQGSHKDKLPGERAQ